MPDRFYECIVLGVGGAGSAACYHLAKKGVRVLGLDQYPPGHDKGSSHGDTRAIRMACFEHPDYVPLLKRSLELWREIDAESDHALFHQTGVVHFGPTDGEVIPGIIEAAERHHLEVEHLSHDDQGRRFPAFRAGEDDAILFDPAGGILRVEDCIRAHVSAAKRAGAALIFGERAKTWRESHDRVIVETQLNRYECDKLVLTPGPWALDQCASLAPHLHLRTKSLFWFDSDEPALTLAANCPVFLFDRGEHTFYGFPAVDDKGVKVADHSGGRRLSAPKKLKRKVDTGELESASLFVRRHLPGASIHLNHHTTCIYTMTPDGNFLLGHYPGASRVNLAAGLSGHGFKFVPVLGEILAELTVDGASRHRIQFLDPARFRE